MQQTGRTSMRLASCYQWKPKDRTIARSKLAYKKQDEQLFLQAQIRLMGSIIRRTPRLNSRLQCASFPLLYPGSDFNLSDLRGRQRVIPNTSVIHSPHFRRWYGLPLISKLGIVLNF